MKKQDIRIAAAMKENGGAISRWGSCHIKTLPEWVRVFIVLKDNIDFFPFMYPHEVKEYKKKNPTHRTIIWANPDTLNKILKTASGSEKI